MVAAKIELGPGPASGFGRAKEAGKLSAFLKFESVPLLLALIIGTTAPDSGAGGRGDERGFPFMVANWNCSVVQWHAQYIKRKTFF